MRNGQLLELGPDLQIRDSLQHAHELVAAEPLGEDRILIEDAPDQGNRGVRINSAGDRIWSWDPPGTITGPVGLVADDNHFVVAVLDDEIGPLFGVTSYLFDVEQGEPVAAIGDDGDIAIPPEALPVGYESVSGGEQQQSFELVFRYRNLNRAWSADLTGLRDEPASKLALADGGVLLAETLHDPSSTVNPSFSLLRVGYRGELPAGLSLGGEQAAPPPERRAGRAAGPRGEPRRRSRAAPPGEPQERGGGVRAHLHQKVQPLSEGRLPETAPEPLGPACLHGFRGV